MEKDKRDECDCHRSCTVLPHTCDNPCIWPDCLTGDELDALDREVMADE